MRARVFVLVLVLVPIGVARAERPYHGSVGAGGTLVMSGAQGDRLRLDVSLDLEPRSRYGVVLGWRAFDENHRGLVTAGISYEGAAARPRLVLALHADVGLDLALPAPLAGGGVRTTLKIVGPVAVVIDLAAFVIIDGVDRSRLQLQSTTLVAARW